MNRQNFPKHLLLAVTIIMVAAMVGQIRRWQRDWKPRPARRAVATTSQTTTKAERPRASEVLVRFRQGTTLERIRDIAFRKNDRIEDRIESVNNLVVMADSDGMDVDWVVNEYRGLPDVEYVEPNYTISL